MKTFTHRRRLFLSLLTLAACVPTLASAQQTYPSRPITLIVPFAAGGGTDSLCDPARLYAK